MLDDEHPKVVKAAAKASQARVARTLLQLARHRLRCKAACGRELSPAVASNQEHAGFQLFCLATDCLSNPGCRFGALLHCKDNLQSPGS